MTRIQIASFSAALIAIVAMVTVPVQVVKAQDSELSITTSADDLGHAFFGEGVLQVIISDPDAGDSGAVEEIEVDIQADPDSGSDGSDDFLIPETNDSSGRFEFFLTHVDADAVSPSDLDPHNGQGVEGDGTCVENCAPVISFGPGGDLDVEADLYEETKFEISIGNTVIDIHYEETRGTVSLDREHYPSTAYVYVTISDQDANLNPTNRDSFLVDPDGGPNADLFDLGGATILEEITFRETGDNTGVFEARYRLGTTIDATSTAVALTLHEKANYGASLAASENDSNDTDDVNFTIGNTSGTITVGVKKTWDAVLSSEKDSYRVGEIMNVTIVDQDRNLDATKIDSIEITVNQGAGKANAMAYETGFNSGIFEISFSVMSDEDVTITYRDQRPADYSEKISEGKDPAKDFVLEINMLSELKTGIHSTNVTAPIAKGVFATDFSVGAHIQLSVNITNNNEQQQPFTALIEVRDFSGITVFLASQSGILEPNDFTQVGAAWAPEVAGEYTLRTFIVTNLNGEVLSPVSSSQITVS